MVRGHKRRKDAIAAFLIPSVGQTIGVDDWSSREPKALWYGLPEVLDYPHPGGGTYARCRVEAFTGDKQSLGYLPLPRRYAEAWVQLCYTVVYWMTQWKAWVRELARPPGSGEQPSQMVQDCVNNSGARFLQYLVIRRLIIDELLQHHMLKDESDQLQVFDEYLVRERFNWLWTDFDDIPVRKRSSLQIDPVHPQNESTFDWSNPALEVPGEMVVPPASPAHTWMWGRINHFDFQALFDQDSSDLVEFYKNKSLQRRIECPYESESGGLPDRWHEAHEPAVCFLTAEEDRVFNPPGGPHVGITAAGREPSPPQVDSPGLPKAGGKRKRVSKVAKPARRRKEASAEAKTTDKRKEVTDEDMNAERQPPPAGPSKPARTLRKCVFKRGTAPKEEEPANPQEPSSAPANSEAGPSHLPQTRADVSDDDTVRTEDPPPSAGAQLTAGQPTPADMPRGIVDNADTRAIVNALVTEDGGIDLAQAHERLQSLLGNWYDAGQWGKLLDNVRCEPGEEPAMTIEDAFQFATVPDLGLSSHAKSMEEYRNVTKAYL